MTFIGRCQIDHSSYFFIHPLQLICKSMLYTPLRLTYHRLLYPELLITLPPLFHFYYKTPSKMDVSRLTALWVFYWD